MACLLMAGVGFVPARATTLEQLSMTSMIQQSTAIVRAKVTGSYAANRKGQIYTFYRLQVLENLKATTPASAEVAVPGGSLNGVQQVVPGAPGLVAGQEYVLFLWTSKSGLTQVIGLSQGLFDVGKDASGNPILSQSPIGDATVNDRTGESSGAKPPSAISLPQLRGKVQQVLGGGQ